VTRKVVYDSGPIRLSGHASAPARPQSPAVFREPDSAGAVEPPQARGPMPVVVGCPRSGTTLVTVMLDSHPELAMPPETAFLPSLGTLEGNEGSALRRAFFDLVTTDRWNVSNWNDLGIDRQSLWRRLVELRTFTVTAGLRVLYGMVADRAGKRLVGEKTPANTNHMPLIESFLPEARFVHIVRDPRDVVMSLNRTSAGSSTQQSAQHWAGMVANARRYARTVRHYHELRYEDLLAEPERLLRGICAFLGLEFTAAMLDYRASGERHVGHLGDRLLPNGVAVVPAASRARLHENLTRPLQKDRAGAWRSEMSTADRVVVERIAGPLMDELGYERSEG
jgi:hypothetical protein